MNRNLVYSMNFNAKKICSNFFNLVQCTQPETAIKIAPKLIRLGFKVQLYPESLNLGYTINSFAASMEAFKISKFVSMV